MSGADAKLTPADLVRRIRGGDPAAEAELVSRFGEGLAFLLRRWTRDSATAEDLYQETFRLALEKIRSGEVREPDRLAGFLRSLAKNLSIHHYRRSAVQEVREENLEAAAGLSALMGLTTSTRAQIITNGGFESPGFTAPEYYRYISGNTNENNVALDFVTGWTFSGTPNGGEWSYIMKKGGSYDAVIGAGQEYELAHYTLALGRAQVERDRSLATIGSQKVTGLAGIVAVAVL